MALAHRNTPGRSNQRPPSVVQRLAGTVLAILLPASAHAALPDLVTTYPIGFGRDATLRSSAACGVVQCEITDTIFSAPLDRLVMLTWKDAQGAPLVSAVNAYFSNAWSPGFFGGYLGATERRTEFSREFAIQQAVGTADFTGTTPGSTPCSLAHGGYICSGAEGASYYYFPPGVFSLPTGAGSAPPAPGLGTEFGRATTRFSTVGIDPATMTVPDDQRFTFLEFTSTVSIDNGMYLYASEVTNHTSLDIPILWTDAGIDETIGASSTKRVERRSPLGPATHQSQFAYRLGNGDFGSSYFEDHAGSTMIFAPVPEPSTLATLGAGLAGLLWQRRRRARAH